MTIEDIRAQVASQRTVIASAVELLRGLHTKLDDAIKSEDPAALQALADDLKSNTDTLASAVQENTPAAPTPPPGEATPATP